MKEIELVPSTKIFIEDFYARKYLGKRTSLYTDILRETAQPLNLDEAFVNDVEVGVITHYKTLGIEAYFTENQFWRVLFALTFWDLLYGREQAQYSEFDRLPAELKQNTFYTNKSWQIESCLNEFSTPKVLLNKLTQRAVAHYGESTGIFRWSPTLIEPIRSALMAHNSLELACVLKRMAKNYTNTNDGYPDLMIIENNEIRFEEIKAPGDVLRPNQLVSINRLRTAGLRVDVSQVAWVTNPNQVYAVVDIETTGGRKGTNAKIGRAS